MEPEAAPRPPNLRADATALYARSRFLQIAWGLWTAVGGAYCGVWLVTEAPGSLVLSVPVALLMFAVAAHGLMEMRRLLFARPEQEQHHSS